MIPKIYDPETGTVHRISWHEKYTDDELRELACKYHDHAMKLAEELLKTRWTDSGMKRSSIAGRIFVAIRESQDALLWAGLITFKKLRDDK